MLQTGAGTEVPSVRLAGLADALAEAVLVVRRDGSAIYANAACEPLFGRQRDGLVGVSLESLVPERIRPWVRVARDQFFSDPGVRRLGPDAGLVGLRADGSEFAAELTAAPMGAPEDPWAVLVVRDATHGKRLARTHRLLADVSGVVVGSLEYENTLARVARMAVPDFADWALVFVEDGQGGVRRVAGALADDGRASLVAEVLRVWEPSSKAEDCIGRVMQSRRPELYADPSTVLERLAGAAGPEAREALRRLNLESAVLAPLTGEDRAAGVLLLAFSGSKRRHGPDDLLLAAELGRRAGLAVVHAELHRELQVAEARYRSLFEGAEDPILVVTDQGELTDANASALGLLGQTAGELVGRALDDPLLAADPAKVRRHLEAMRTERRWRGEMDLLRKDGTELPLEARAAPLGDGGFVVIAREISERRALEKMQRDFIALVTHELRNPLSVVKGYSQLMLRGGAAGGRGLSAIVAQVNHMDRLVNDLLEASRIDAGKLELRRTEVDLVSVTRGCCDQARTLSRKHTIQLVAPDGPVLGHWDRDRLEEVLQNLLSNALKYSPEGGEIEVRLEEEAGGSTVVSVRDAGIGISADTLPLLFRRFSRAEGAASVAQGLGLGLYVSRSLVEAHGGRIWAEPAPGRGSVFTFSLPRAPVSPA